MTEIREADGTQHPAVPHRDGTAAAERAVLACMMRGDEDLRRKISGRLTTFDFEDPKNRLIYAACLIRDWPTIINEKGIGDVLAGAGKLDAAGGMAYIASLDLDLPDLRRVEAYVEFVKERSVRRRLKRSAAELLGEARES